MTSNRWFAGGSPELSVERTAPVFGSHRWPPLRRQTTPPRGPRRRHAPQGAVQLWRSYLHDLMAETARAYAQGASLDEARTRVAEALATRFESRFMAVGLPAERFRSSLVGNIEKAYRVVSGQQS